MVYHHADNPSCPIIDYVPFADRSFKFDDTIGCCNHDGISDDFNYDMTLNDGDVTVLVKRNWLGVRPHNFPTPELISST